MCNSACCVFPHDNCQLRSQMMHLRSCNNVRLRPLNCKKPVWSFCGRCNCLQQCHKTGNTGGAKAAGRVQMHFSVFLCLIDLRFAICIFVRHTHTPSICNIRCRCNILKSVKHCHCAECWTETPSCSDVFTQSWLSHQKECSPKHDSNQAPPCNQCCCKRRSHLWMHTEAFDAHKPIMMHLHIASKMQHPNLPTMGYTQSILMRDSRGRDSFTKDALLSASD